MAPSQDRLHTAKLLTVSNRGPVEFHRDEEGKIVAVPGQGGLATALRVAAQLYPTTWLSSPISPLDREMAAGGFAPGDAESESLFVATDAKAYDLFYGHFANSVLWFLQHLLPLPEELSGPLIEEAWRDGYLAVNRAFANRIAEELATGDIRAVIFHDYHFYAAPRLVRERAPNAYLQHFVHIPWPAPAGWAQLDPAILAAICDGLLANDSLVFQTPNDAARFIETCVAALPDVSTDHESIVRYAGHATRVWSNGISVDIEELLDAAASPEFSRYRYLLRPDPALKTIVRVDRLDPTKNILAGFKAYARLLDDHPELHESVHFLAQVFPSRSDIATYVRYQEEVLSLAQSINRRFGNLHWKPIRLLIEHNRMQALAAMSLYDVLLVNPLADGMNLVAKEGPILNTREGVLVLSRRAGAFAELGCGALAIDPEDVEATKDALYAALTMPISERRERAARIRHTVRQRDLRDWFRALLSDIEANAPEAVTSAA
jgi:trehalose 6-phosphate synthase